MSLFTHYLAKGLSKLFRPSPHREETREDHYIPKTYGSSGEDQYIQELNPSPEDLARYGTREGLIDVANDRMLHSKRQTEIDIQNRIFKAPQKPSHKRFSTTYEEDLERFGTRETLIDVANDSAESKQNIVRGKKETCHSEAISEILQKDLISQGKLRDPGRYSQNPFADAYKDFSKVQVTINNTSNEDQRVTLWGAARYGTTGNFSLGNNQPGVLTTISHPQAVYPQAILYNPVNQLLYVANQISGTVTVINADNEIVTVVALNPTFSGLSSAIALTVNTEPASAYYGSVYVAGSISNTVSVITTAFAIAAEIPVGIRPVSLAFNHANNMVYVANFNSNTLSVISTETNSVVTSVNVGANPVGLGVNPMSGETYVSNASSNTMMVVDSENNIVNTVTYVGTYPTSIIYNPLNDSMYAIARDSNQVHQFNAATYQLMTTLNVGPNPYNSFFNPADGMLYVQSSTSGNILLIDQNNLITSILNTGIQSIGAAIHPLNNLLYISNPLAGNVQVWSHYSPSLQAAGSLSIDDNYSTTNADFQYAPAVIKHARFIMNGPERINSFRIEQFTPTGRTKRKAISFETFASPLLRLNVAEAVSLAGTVVDGQTAWHFILPPHQSLSILIWYVQIRKSKLFTNPQNPCT